jgi:capsular exopolysaccharide synthesis family protein
MTRLREALEKAATEPVDAEPGTPSAARHFSDPTQLIPECWDLDGFEAAAAPEPEAPKTAEVPEVASESDGDAVAGAPLHRGNGRLRQTHPQTVADVWATYRFGDEATSKVIVGPNPDGALVEQYRKLGASLHHHQLQGGTRTLMVTSAVASEGKTLTATNLALTLSHSYKRSVLLIDADLRQPNIHEVLRLPNVMGLSESLRHGDPTRLRYQTVSPMLSVLTAGRPDSDPMAGLVSDTMSRILTDAAAQFDWVIVDTPPVALLPDANLLAAMIDAALLVVSANATPYPLVMRAVEAIGEQRILGIVLNRMARAEMVGAYNYYGYGGHYYGSNNDKGSALRRLLPWLGRRTPESAAADVRK